MGGIGTLLPAALRRSHMELFQASPAASVRHMRALSLRHRLAAACISARL